MTTTAAPAGFEDRPLLKGLIRNWWALLLRGIAAVVFGILALLWPGLTLLTLTFLWGAYVLIDGVFALWAAIVGKVEGVGARWWLGVVGALGILVGLMALAAPAYTAGVLLTVIAAWAIVIGVLQILGAVRLRKEIEGEWFLIVSGIVSVLFGLAVVFQPVAGALAVVWMISLFAILFGVALIALALKLRSAATRFLR